MYEKKEDWYAYNAEIRNVKITKKGYISKETDYTLEVKANTYLLNLVIGKVIFSARNVLFLCTVK